MYVCLCKGITDSDIESAINDGASTLRELRAATGLSTDCGSCVPDARALLVAQLAAKSAHTIFYPAEAVTSIGRAQQKPSRHIAKVA